MATFLIHEDIGAADVCGGGALNKANGAAFRKGDDKNGALKPRKTLAQLNNHAVISAANRAHAHQQTNNGKAAVVAAAAQKCNDENDVPHQLLALAAKKAATLSSTTTTTAAAAVASALQEKLPVDQFKAFYAYENEQKISVSTAEANNSICSDIDLSMIRQPLQELKNDHLETPMSVTDLLSPMSIDKSAANASSSASMSSCPAAALKSERDRFFEIEEYQHDILSYLKEAETRHLPKFGYMRKQPDINHSMRTILVDWLVEVCEEYRLQSETLCLAVSYIDRFLSVMSVVRAKLQLVGTAAMFIAAKYEEIYPPDVNEFVYITDTTYTKKQVLRMEQLILKVLTFDLFVPTLFTFINIYVTMNEVEDRVKYLATYFCELSLLDADPYLQFVPSKIAAAALALANYTLALPMWSKKLETNVGYTMEELHDLMFLLSKSHAAALSLPQQAIQEKYKSSKYLSVSTTIAAAEMDEEQFARAVIRASEVDEQNEENDDDEEESTSALDESATGENVRKMISSLIFT